MIDWNKSAKLHDMKVDELKAYFEKFPKSQRKIMAICDDCNKKRCLQYRSYHNLCLTCSNTRNKSRKILIICNNCGKEIKRSPARIKDHNFCCRICYNKWHKENMSDSNNPSYIERVIITCDNCKTEIEKLPAQINDHNFCCKKCGYEYQSKNIHGKKHPLYVERMIITCDNCGEKIKRVPSQIKNHNFCDKKCKYEYQSKNICGEKHHNYKDDILLICKECEKEYYVPLCRSEISNFCSIKCKSDYFSKNLEFKKKISASKQHIAYDEWENFARYQKYCPKYNEECKESNREKYNRRCFLSGLPESENMDKNGKQWKLATHHYDMDKGQGCDGKKWKLVPLCLEWHGKVHNKLWEARIIWLLDNVW